MAEQKQSAAKPKKRKLQSDEDTDEPPVKKMKKNKEETRKKKSIDAVYIVMQEKYENVHEGEKETKIGAVYNNLKEANKHAKAMWKYEMKNVRKDSYEIIDESHPNADSFFKIVEGDQRYGSFNLHVWIEKCEVKEKYEG